MLRVFDRITDALRRRLLRARNMSKKFAFWLRVQVNLKKITWDTPCDRTLVFFAPFGIDQHFGNLTLFARALQNKGYRVLFVVCNETMNQCLLMGMRSNTHEILSEAEKKQFCATCVHKTQEVFGGGEFPIIDMNSILGKEGKKKISECLDAFPNLESIVWDNYKLADLSLIDLALLYKQRTLSSGNADMDEVIKDYVYSSILAYEAIKKLSQMLPISTLVFNADYTVHLTAAMAAQNGGAKFISVGAISHRLGDWSRNHLYPDIWEVMLYRYFLDWPRWKNLPVGGSMIKEISDDLLLRWKPKSGPNAVYSPPIGPKPTSWREKFGIPSKAKLVVAYTSSVDEAISTQKALDVWKVRIDKLPQPYNDQIDWLRDLLSYFKKNTEELFLVVRIHPREGKNSVDVIESEHLFDLRKNFQNKTPHNVRFVWPEDNVSSYELAEEADLVLISWSNIGLELARVGVPVLASMIRISCVPFDDFIVRVDTKERYFETLRSMIEQPASLETIARAYRWYHLCRLGGSVDLSDIRPDYRSPLAIDKEPAQYQTIENVIAKGADILELNFVNLVNANSNDPSFAESERQSILEEICRTISFIMTGEFLNVEETLSLLRNLETKHDLCQLEYNGRKITRVSRLVARLHELVAQEQTRSKFKDSALGLI